MIRQVNGELAEAVETGDLGKVRTCLMMQQLNSHKVKWTRETERATLFANPDSEEVRTCWWLRMRSLVWLPPCFFQYSTGQVDRRRPEIYWLFISVPDTNAGRPRLKLFEGIRAFPEN